MRSDNSSPSTRRRVVRAIGRGVVGTAAYSAVASASEPVDTGSEWRDDGTLRFTLRNQTNRTILRVRYRVTWKGRAGDCVNCAEVGTTTISRYFLSPGGRRSVALDIPEDAYGWETDLVDTMSL